MHKDLKITAGTISIAWRKFLDSHLASHGNETIEDTDDKNFQTFLNAIDLNNPENPLYSLAQEMICEDLSIPIYKDHELFNSAAYLFRAKNVPSNEHVIFYVSGDDSFMFNPLTVKENLIALQKQIVEFNLTQTIRKEMGLVNLPAFHYLAKQGYTIIGLNHPTQDINGWKALKHVHPDVEPDDEPLKTLYENIEDSVGKAIGFKSPFVECPAPGICYVNAREWFPDVFDSIKLQILEIIKNHEQYNVLPNCKFKYWGHSRGSIVGLSILDDPELRPLFIELNLCGAQDFRQPILESIIKVQSEKPEFRINVIQGIYDLRNAHGLLELSKSLDKIDSKRFTVYIPDAGHSNVAGNSYIWLKNKQFPDDDAKKKAIENYTTQLTLLEGGVITKNYLDCPSLIQDKIKCDVTLGEYEQKIVYNLLSLKEKETFLLDLFNQNNKLRYDYYLHINRKQLTKFMDDFKSQKAEEPEGDPLCSNFSFFQNNNSSTQQSELIQTQISLLIKTYQKDSSHECLRQLLKSLLEIINTDDQQTLKSLEKKISWGGWSLSSFKKSLTILLEEIPLFELDAQLTTTSHGVLKSLSN